MTDSGENRLPRAAVDAADAVMAGSPPQLHITHDYCPGCGGTGVLWLSWRYIGPCPGCKGEGVVAR